MQQYLDILKQYWGYDDFRPLQGDIIRSIVSGKDTLGLMPTGGGKSLTFQVPTLAMKGICVVVTPLIALMKDQVENLKKRGITAAAIYSGMSHNDILMTLDNAVFEAYKFLYVSPERLATPIFMEKIKQATVCMIAVDESHCISQWGYDFRPSYLRIADIRELLPDVPVLALTATATPEVVDDIQRQLHFREPNVFQKSFHRSNLAYVVRTTENKDEHLLKILNSVPGTSVVYVRNRKRTKEISDFLNLNGISAENFHAGLKNETKDAKQSRWKSGETRVIVSTNAFGMGIDKAEVRTVVHMDLPDSLEAYFQEAGRAGRDEKKAYAVLLYNNGDAVKMRKRVSDSFPGKEMVLKVYEALGNYLEMGVGSGLDRVFAFDIGDFCTKFKLPILITYNCLKILQQAGYLELTDEQDSSARVLFIVGKDDLYNQKQTPEQEKLIHILLRSYTGLFTDMASINEETIAKRLEWTREKVYEELVGLAKERVIQFIPRKKTPYLTFVREREATERVILGKEAYDDRRERYIARVKSVLDYAKEENICRSQVLLSYFGEKETKPCGKCDICQKKKETLITEEDFETIRQHIEQALSAEELSVNVLLKKVPFKELKVLQVIRFLKDNGQLKENELMKLSLVK
ncbi:ATP-dependent DNA helicase RecQ [Paludibacter propionicigenes WB4]|uniref:ATP-dependent DNA helicase RecQ n=1 Tax=Paludibacter propionicigenes (strain DSM 17365 / JCM 13257 / WB4) TaxID=694427 RepID=E4T8A9_PALPW|nr:ATP-dependent DNA helicase RecQ [Paludibacter propionicigenes]ADQ80953.1 ATP-dependent DNA helicase RecQ [Paludibacter propionicigenes WB4]